MQETWQSMSGWWTISMSVQCCGRTSSFANFYMIRKRCVNDYVLTLSRGLEFGYKEVATLIIYSLITQLMCCLSHQ